MPEEDRINPQNLFRFRWARRPRQGRRGKPDDILRDLRAAAAQEDAEAAAWYRRILALAEAEAANGPVIVSVHQDGTNVWWVCTVTAFWGGGPANYRRATDEGGTLPNHLLAALEAARICDRLGKRVEVRDGFDSEVARERLAKINGATA